MRSAAQTALDVARWDPLAARQSPRAGHPALGDQRQGHVGRHEQVALDALASRGQTGAAAPPPEAYRTRMG